VRLTTPLFFPRCERISTAYVILRQFVVSAPRSGIFPQSNPVEKDRFEFSLPSSFTGPPMRLSLLNDRLIGPTNRYGSLLLLRSEGFPVLRVVPSRALTRYHKNQNRIDTRVATPIFFPATFPPPPLFVLSSPFFYALVSYKRGVMRTATSSRLLGSLLSPQAVFPPGHLSHIRHMCLADWALWGSVPYPEDVIGVVSIFSSSGPACPFPMLFPSCWRGSSYTFLLVNSRSLFMLWETRNRCLSATLLL